MVEKRRYVRIDHPIRIRYRVAHNLQSDEEAVSKNIGGRGVCLILNRSIQVGSSLKLSFRLPGVYPAIEARGKVVWTNKLRSGSQDLPNGTEAGVQFTSISNASKACIINFVYESLKRRNQNHLRKVRSRPMRPRCLS